MPQYSFGPAALIGALVMFPASAQVTESDHPHRPWGKVAVLDMTLQDATTCIARELDTVGGVLVLPTERGNDIDFKLGGPFLTPDLGNALERFQLREHEGTVKLTVLYRHPFSAKAPDGAIKSLRKRCLKVVSITEQGPD